MSEPITRELIQKHRLKGAAPLFSEFYPLSVKQFNETIDGALDWHDYLKPTTFYTYMASSLAGVFEFDYFPDISVANIVHVTEDLYDLDSRNFEYPYKELKEQYSIRASKINDLEKILNLEQISRRVVKYFKFQQEKLGANWGTMMDIWQEAGYLRAYEDIPSGTIWLVKISPLPGDGDVPLARFM